MELITGVDFDTILMYFSMKVHFSALRVRVDRYCVFLLVNDLCADFNLNFTHNNITNFIIEEKGQIFQHYNFIRRELNRKVLLYKHDHFVDNRYPYPELRRIVDTEELYQRVIERELSLLIEAVC